VPTLSDLPVGVLAAYATLTAAVIAAVAALTTALVTGFNQRWLAGENSHREYRRELVSPLFSYERAVAFNMNRFKLSLFPASKWDQTRKILSSWVEAMEEVDGTGAAIYVSYDVHVRDAFLLLGSAQDLLVSAIGTISPSVQDGHSFIEAHCDAVLAACSCVELAGEAFVFPARGRTRVTANRLTEVQTLIAFLEVKYAPVRNRKRDLVG
jgi:hypothetical protein